MDGSRREGVEECVRQRVRRGSCIEGGGGRENVVVFQKLQVVRCI